MTHKTKQLRLYALLLSLAVFAVSLSGCKMTEEKAVQLYKDSFDKNSTIESGDIAMNLTGAIILDDAGEDQFSAKLSGSMQDKWKTYAFQIAGSAMGQNIDMEICMKDGSIYTKSAGDEKYSKTTTAKSTGLSYDQLLSLGGPDIKNLFINAIGTAQDLSFVESNGNTVLTYSLSKENLAAIEGALRTMILDQVLPKMEDQIRTTAKEEVKKSIPYELSAADQKTMDDTVEQQVAAIIAIERELFNSLRFDSVAMEATMDKQGFAIGQKVDMKASFDIKAMGKALGAEAMTLGLPENCSLTLTMDYTVNNLNKAAPVKLPEFTSENTATAAETPVPGASGK